MLLWEDATPISQQTVAAHWGGGMVFGSDGNLYLAIGDKWDVPEHAQNLSLAAGKVMGDY